MQSWAAEELKYTRLPDKRLNQRLFKIVEQALAQPTASVPQASGDWTSTKATYNFWNSERFEYEDILDGHRQKTVERVLPQDLILAIQDTSDFNFTHHKSKTWKQGFGQTCSQPYVTGLKVHSNLAVSSTGIPLGVLDLQIWSREPKKQTKKPKKTKPKSILQKESKRWLRGLLDAELTLPSTTTVVTVADREGDIFELLALPREDNSELLIRAKHNRRIDNSMRYLKESISQMPEAGKLEIVLPKRKGKPSRIATLSIRFSNMKILAPSNLGGKQKREPINMNVISVVEENPPNQEKPINWLLLTTLKVDNWQDAVTCIRWYTYRWLIERYHYVLKSGCGIENLQLETAERIKKALATYAIVAWRLLWLTYHSRENPFDSCETILSEEEWHSLYCQIQGNSKIPKKPPNLKQVIIWIGKLGGFLGRKSDGEPGVKCLWRGLRRLSDITSSWRLAKSSSSKVYET